VSNSTHDSNRRRAGALERLEVIISGKHKHIPKPDERHAVEAKTVKARIKDGLKFRKYIKRAKGVPKSQPKQETYIA
jgi:hypothetical protein